MIEREIEIYDRLAPVYDARYLSAECFEENEIVRQTVLDLCGTDAEVEMLDVGCGTGLALDLKMISPNCYVGIDPSLGMVSRLVTKHATAKHVEIISFEEYVDEGVYPPDLGIVVSLFGSPSYIPSEYIAKMMRMAPRVVSMHYQPGYWPEYEPKPETMDESREEALLSCKELGGRSFDLNNFVVVVIGGSA